MKKEILDKYYTENKEDIEKIKDGKDIDELIALAKSEIAEWNKFLKHIIKLKKKYDKRKY